jgi:rhomboid protease GluP
MMGATRCNLPRPGWSDRRMARHLIPLPTQKTVFFAWVTRVLVGANVLVFLAMAAAGAGLLRPDTLVHIAWGSNFAPLTVNGQWWRLVTSTFVHFGALHLLLNMWVLWGTGGLVERLFGHGRFAAIYAVSGAVGSLASVAWNPLVNSAGASGAIFGLIGAQLAFFLRGGHRIPEEVIRAQRTSIVGFIAFSVIFGITVPGIDNAAHLGGLASGFCMGWLLARPLGMPYSAKVARGGIVLALLFTCTILPAGIWAAGRTASGHLDEQAFLRNWNWYSTEEPQVLARTRTAMADARDRKLSDAQVVGLLEREAIPFYRDALQRLGAQKLPGSSPLAGQQAQAIDFTRGRVAGFELMVEGIRENDRAKLERAVRQLGGAQAAVGAGSGQ